MSLGRGILSKQYMIPSKCGISSTFEVEVIFALDSVSRASGNEDMADEVKAFACGEV
jgi:hypothetical protein